MSTNRIALLFAAVLLVFIAWQLPIQGLHAQSSIGTAEITSPTEGTTVTGSVTIKGTATITGKQAPYDFQYYKVEYMSTGSPWVMVDGSTHTTPVTAGTLATWDTTKASDGWYKLRVAVVDNTGQWGSSTEVSVLVANAAAAAEAAKPHRGCESCHELRDPATGRYTLWYEATSRARAAELSHPEIPRDADLDLCLTCHGRGTGDRAGMGVAAELNLMDILHPAHMYSATFTERYNGSCFTCHNVNEAGTFTLIKPKIEVNDKGVPEVVPIPGQIVPRQP